MISIEDVIAVCIGFSTMCVAAGWLIKIIKALKAPADKVNSNIKNNGEQIGRNDKRISMLERQNGFILKAISLLLQDDLVILNHLRTTNNTGEMAEQETKVQDFLLTRAQDDVL